MLSRSSRSLPHISFAIRIITGRGVRWRSLFFFCAFKLLDLLRPAWSTTRSVVNRQAEELDMVSYCCHDCTGGDCRSLHALIFSPRSRYLFPPFPPRVSYQQSKASKNKKAAKTYERPGLSEEEIEEIREAFNLFDTDGSGDPRSVHLWRCLWKRPHLILLVRDVPGLCFTRNDRPEGTEGGDAIAGL